MESMSEHVQCSSTNHRIINYLIQQRQQPNSLPCHYYDNRGRCPVNNDSNLSYLAINQPIFEVMCLVFGLNCIALYTLQTHQLRP